MAHDCVGCGKSIYGRSKFCTKDCRGKYLARVDAHANRDTSKDIPVRINSKTIIYVKSREAIPAAVAKYEALLAGITNVPNRGIALNRRK